MKRGKPLRKTSLQRGDSQLKRSPLQPMSDNRREVNAQRAALMVETFGPRHKWVCSASHLIPTPCYGTVNGHEVKSRARAGRTDANLLDMNGIILLCNHHNEWCESNPDDAHALGLVKHSWE
jgi:hypothetical protein